MVSGVRQPTHGKSESGRNSYENGEANRARKKQQDLPAKVAPSRRLTAMPALADSAALFYHAVKQDEPHYAVDVDKQQGKQQSKYHQGADRRGEQQWIRGGHAGWDM